MSKMSLQELLSTTVTTPSKNDQEYFDTAAAIYVITGEDIKRSGARTVPEALRLAPGLHVARINKNQYAISARGQNDMFSDKLLVMIDGRSVYTPTFSGVWWGTVNVPLDDIDRIEIVRGPGAVMWGSNAVNGVINIITKSALLTQRLRLSAVAGNEERAAVNVRYGGANGEDMFYRVYLMGEDHDGGYRKDALDGFDDRQLAQGGFRMDWDTSPDSRLTMHGDVFSIKAGAVNTYVVRPGVEEVFEKTQSYDGANLNLEYTRDLNESQTLKTFFYADTLQIGSFYFKERRDTYKAEAQYDIATSSTNRISVGADYLFSRDLWDGTDIFHMSNEDYHLYSAFAQDELYLLPNRLSLIAGVKLEHNQYSGWEVQPNVRLAYTGDTHTIWVSVARAVRLPNRVENDIRYDLATDPRGDIPLVHSIIGDGRSEPEELTAYEIGLRWQPTETAFFDLAGYYNDYKKLVDEAILSDIDVIMSESGAYALVPHNLENVLEGKAYGFEIAAMWKPYAWLTLSGAYSYCRQIYYPAPEYDDGYNRGSALWQMNGFPLNQANARIGIDLARNVTFDIVYYYTAALYDHAEIKDNEDLIPAIHRADSRVSWRPVPGWELAAVIQGVFDDRWRENPESYLEFDSWSERSYYLQVIYRP